MKNRTLYEVGLSYGAALAIVSTTLLRFLSRGKQSWQNRLVQSSGAAIAICAIAGLTGIGTSAVPSGTGLTYPQNQIQGMVIAIASGVVEVLLVERTKIFFQLQKKYVWAINFVIFGHSTIFLLGHLLGLGNTLRWWTVSLSVIQGLIKVGDNFAVAVALVLEVACAGHLTRQLVNGFGGAQINWPMIEQDVLIAFSSCWEIALAVFAAQRSEDKTDFEAYTIVATSSALLRTSFTWLCTATMMQDAERIYLTSSSRHSGSPSKHASSAAVKSVAASQPV